MRKTNRRTKMPRHYGTGRSSGMTAPKPKKKGKKNGTKKKKVKQPKAFH